MIDDLIALGTALREAWHSATKRWKDSRARDFEARFVEPLNDGLRQFSSAVARMEESLARAESDLADP